MAPQVVTSTPEPGHRRVFPVTAKTLLKARTIFKNGGVERTGPSSYLVTSTSGETYGVWTKPAYCMCPTPRDLTCSHQAAVDIYISKRRAAV